MNASILFLFSAFSGKEILADIERGTSSDTVLRGMNHIPNALSLNVGATVRERMGILENRIPSEIAHLSILPDVLKSNFVIASDQLFLGYVVSLLHVLIGTKTKWIYMAINSSGLIRRHKHHPFRKGLLKLFWNSYAHIICLSQEQLEDFRSIGIPASHLSFIPFGVDTGYFSAQSMSSNKEEKKVLSLGRDLGRDFTTLLQAAKLVHFPITIVTSPRNIPKGVEIPPNVTVVYDAPIQKVREYYMNSKLLVVVSKDQDSGTGSDCSGQTVLLESMAAGCAVIATDRSWIRDYFVIGEECIVVPPKNPEVLAKAIIKLWDDTDARESIAIAGQKKVVGNYSTTINS
jgi:glycosyltransferase involved in cell wall biosynthesis